MHCIKYALSKRLYVNRACNGVSSASAITDARQSTMASAIQRQVAIQMQLVIKGTFNSHNLEIVKFEMKTNTNLFTSNATRFVHLSWIRDAASRQEESEKRVTRREFTASRVRRSLRLPRLRFDSWENRRGGLGQSAQYPGLIRQSPVTTWRIGRFFI